MLITITPIGSTASDVSAAAGAYVEYLCGSNAAATTTSTGTETSEAGIVSYYSAEGDDLVDGPGWWSGGGAQVLELAGQPVETATFRALLQGRHHISADRLISAQGSSGRIHLKAGQPTRLHAGQPMWSIRDATAALGSPIPDGLIAADEFTIHEGRPYLGLAAMRTLLETTGKLRPQITLDDIAAGPQRVTIAELSEALDLSPQYLRRVCQHITDGHRDDPTNLRPTKTGRAWTVDRDGALKWNQTRDQPNVRVGYDTTLTTEKSISLLRLCGPDANTAAIDALQAANTVAMRWLETNASSGRHRGARINSHGHTVASFMHGTSRNDDPFLHIHNVVLNAIVDEHNTGRALDASGLYAQAPAAAALATAAMRRQLTDRVGVDWRLSGRDTWEIAGINDTVIDAFSTRATDIRDALAELTDTPATPDLRDEVARATRRPKRSTTATQLSQEWLTRADQIGFDETTRQSVIGQRRAVVDDELSDSDRAALWRWMSSPAGVCANAATARLGDVFWAITNWAPHGRLRLLHPDQILAEAANWLGSNQVVLIDTTTRTTKASTPIGAAAEPLWTTVAIVELQHSIAQLWASGHSINHAVAARDHTAAAIRNANVELSDEQAALVHSWVHSGHRIQAALGRPGTGKTTTMAVAADAWTRSGFTVLGAAVKGEAARLLGQHAGIDSDTVAAYLARWRRGRPLVDATTVLIVDEASTLSDWDLGALIAMCDQTGATLRLIGDPAQHTSVEAGGSWARLIDQFAVDTPELKHQRRLQNPTEIAATELVRSHDFAAALQKLDEAGSLRRFDSWADAAVPLIKRWWHYRQTGQSHPLVERTNDRRKVLNALAQHVRVAAGEVTALTAIGAKTFGVGDEVIAREPNKTLTAANDAARHVRNGSVGTIAKIEDHTIWVDFDSLGLIEVPRTWAAKTSGLELAYAMTSYSIQGATNDASTSVISRGVGAAELLVNVTRGRNQNIVFAVGDTDAEFSTQPPDDIATAIAATVRVNPNLPATAVDPTVIERAADSNQPLATLETNTDDPHLRQRWNQRQTGLDLHIRLGKTSQQLALVLGERPDNPLRRARWEAVAKTVMAYLDRHQPTPVTNPPTRIDAVLGAPTTEAGLLDRARTQALVETYVDQTNGRLQQLEPVGIDL